MKLKKLMLATAASILLPSLVFASSASQLVNKVIKGQAVVKKQFSSIGNLEGFVLAPKSGHGRETVVYADKDGRYMIAGAVIDAKGQNVTQQDFQKQVTSAIAPKVYAAAKKTNSILLGNPKAPHQLYAIVEPNCSACHLMYKALKPMIDSGQVAMHLIVVAFLKQDSMAKAAAVLQSQKPGLAFAADEKGFDMQTESGAITPSKTITAATKKKLKENLAFMSKFGFIGTPVMIYKTKDGQYNVIRGFLPGKALQDAVKTMSK